MALNHTEPHSESARSLDFRQLFEAVAGLYVVLAPDLTIVAVSDAYLRATKTSRETILGRDIFDVFPDNPDDPSATGERNLRSSLERVLSKRVTDTMAVQKYDIRRPGDERGGFEERYWNLINVPVLGEGNAVKYIIHRIEDVTELVRARQRETEQEQRADDLSLQRMEELQVVNQWSTARNEELERIQAELLERKRNEQIVRVQSEELRVTLESIGDAVIVTDLSCRVTMLNPVAETLTGWKEDDAIGKPLPDVFRIIDQQTRQAVENPSLRALSEGIIIGLANHTILVARDGTERSIDDSAAPIRTTTGTVRGAVLVFRDVTERYAAEEALAHERMLLRTLIDSLPDAIWTKDNDGRFAISNPQHNKLVGQISEAEVIGKSGFDFHPEDLASEYHRDDLRVLHDGETIFNKEELVRDSSGREWWHLAIKAPLRNRDGKITGLVGVSRNIQERKEAELALRVSERRYRAFFEVTTAGVVEVTTDAIIIRANEAFCRMLGYTREEISGMPVVNLMFPEDRDDIRSQYNRLVTGQAPTFEAERRYRCKDGAMIWARVSAVLVQTEAGMPNWVCAVAIDLTARRNAEEFLRDSEERFRLLVEGVKDHAVFMTDSDGKVMTWNAGAERVFGYSAAEVEGRHFSIFYPPNEAAEGIPQQHLDRAVESSIETEGLRVRADGKPFWADTTITALRNDRNGFRGFAMIVHDTTERRRLESQVRQVQKMEAVGRLAGGVAHDFNNLLTVINGYSEMLIAAIQQDDAHWVAVNAIREAGERAASLTAQLLAFSRKAIVESKVLELNDVVVQSERLLRRLIGEDIILTTALVPDLRRVRADPSQMERIVLNLAVNARDAMPRGGRLTIETHDVDLQGNTTAYPGLQPGRYVQLAVTDTGVGMTEEVKSQIFEPFFTTKEAGHGTGLGLAMVYGAVKTHRGHVSVYSEVGVGTTFKILLPATDSDAVPKSGVVRIAPRGTETVMLVEDADPVRELARLTLEMYGYKVLHARNGAEGIRVVDEYSGQIHLLVTDVVMPGMSGREVAEALRQRYPGLKILYASGYTDDAVVRHGIVEATDAFLQKPFTPLTLARKVRAVLDSST
ncbi:MAG TPA: PAS domain S-box protein [Gemmata sp.]|jgi:PAS domain S-box-containing protein|nr:PAS domain S-box protein [Gemmata sp.]